MLNLTIRQLRAVAEIHRLGKVNLAARALGLTGPAVTLQIRHLEEEAGMRLFERTRSGMVPTEAGLAFLETAHSVAGELDRLEDALNAIKGLGKGRIRLGVVSTGKYFAPRLIAAFQRQTPGIEVNLFIGNRTETIDKLKNREIDIALMGRPPRDFEVRSRIFGDHPLVFIAPVSHPLAGELDIPRERLAEETFIIRERGSGTRLSLEIFMSDIPSKLDNLGIAMDSNETIKQAVIADLGIAFISAHTIEQELKHGTLTILDVVDTPIRRNWFTVSRAGAPPSPALEAFEDFMHIAAARYLPLVSKPYPASAFNE